MNTPRTLAATLMAGDAEAGCVATAEASFGRT